jgi:hypothetical protein
MFGEQFYPTPREVILKMVEPFKYSKKRRDSTYEGYSFGGLSIFDPEGGNGAILDLISEVSQYNTPKLFTCEIDHNLASILKEKNYRLIGNDFLDYQDDYFFDIIFMNPPFKNGAEHVLKGWDVVKAGGSVHALLNSETTSNLCNKNRVLLNQLIKDNGSIEELDSCFSNAERKTDVKVVLVRLYKPEEESKFKFSFEGNDKETEMNFDNDIVGDELALNDVLGSVIRSHDKTKLAYINYIKARKELEYYSEPIIPKGSCIINIANESLKNNKSLESAYNDFNDGFKFLTWKKIINMVGIDKLMTSHVRANFSKFTEGQSNMSITKDNIRDLVMMLVQNSGTILDQAVVDVFDLFTKYHKENRCHVEGWKTNESWKVNKKVILPYYVEVGYRGYFSTNHRHYEDYRDIEKAMCYLTGKDYKAINSIEDCIKNFEVGSSKKADSEFFEFRCYKKGTVHIFFKEESLWARFNQKACEGKQWLGKAA